MARLKSLDSGEIRADGGVFSCRKKLNCANHICIETCGKTRLEEKRHSCLDPIPTCSQFPRSVDVALLPALWSVARQKWKIRNLLSNPNNILNADWDPHLCQLPCESLCHSGHCPPCLQTIFTDLTCSCGTPPPSCQLPCSVPQPCSHPASHSCLFRDCPPCSVPVAKECIGGHVVLRNIPCGSKDIRCNKLCVKTRQCGLHACGRTCHLPPCDNLSVVTCGAPRRDCRHTCIAPCHPSTPSPDTRCEFPVTITCSCGRITENVPCDAGANYNADVVHEASIIQKLPVLLQPVAANGKKAPLRQRKLMCNDDCAKLERKRVLADVYEITTPNLDSLHFGENSIASELLADMLRSDSKWVLSVEERCKFLVLGKSRGNDAHGPKVHVFCPMLKDKGDAVRVIAERWKLVVNAAGREPKHFSVNLSGKSRWKLVSALVLRFGGKCELVWLNDKNALAVFNDPARAATAMRRFDHGTVYKGAVMVVVPPNVGASVASSATNA
ncbi:hypothetical protein JHK87_013841 [Glycine soja]|nr:hypothetical protein JHK87_013841 [Glycine soja]